MVGEANGVAPADVSYETWFLNAAMNEESDGLETREGLALLALTEMLWVFSRTNPLTEGFDPVVVDHHGVRCVAAFTTGDAAKSMGEIGAYGLINTGISLARGLAPDLGILVSNGTSSFVVQASYIQTVLHEGRDILNRIIASPPDDLALRVSVGALFLEVMVTVPSRSDPSLEGGIQPLVIDHGGSPFLIVATAPLALERLGAAAPFAVDMLGSDLAKMAVPGLGLVLDNGVSLLPFAAGDVALFKAKLAARSQPPAT